MPPRALASIIVLAIINYNLIYSVRGECDLSVFTNWSNSEGSDIFVKSNLCETGIKYLQRRLAGGHGPILLLSMRKIMCSDDCLINDALHTTAMEKSGCTCSELSSDSHIKQDFCKQNSARLLCEHLGVCGTWSCILGDYSCPRHEWDQSYACLSVAIAPTYALVVCALFLAHHLPEYLSSTID